MKQFIALLFLIAALLVGGCGKDKEVAPESMPAITSIDEISGASDKSSLVGRKVEYTSAIVRDVVGDYVFWVGDQNGALPVTLEAELRGLAKDGNIRIQRGDRLKISGTVRLVSELPADDPFWRLIDAEEKREIEASGVYVAGDSVSH